VILLNIILALVFLAGLIGTIAFNSDVKKILIMRGRVKNFSFNEYLAYAILFCVLCLCVIHFFELMEGDRSAAKVLLLFPSIASIYLVISEYGIHKFIKKHWKLLGAISGVAGVLATVYINPYVDGEIVRLTKLNASSFDNAQNLIRIILTPFFAVLALSYVVLVLYFVHALILIIKQLRDAEFLRKLAKALIYIGTGKRIKKDYKFNVFVDASILLGLLIYVFFIPKQLSESLGEKQLNLDKLIVSALVFADYHEKGIDSCSNINDPEILISFIKKNRISGVKELEKNKYQFYVDECLRHKSSQLPDIVIKN
jgi:hypothetical protein